MVLREQVYRKLNKVYFHGSKTGSLSEKDKVYSSFYLTLHFDYAALYACQDNPLEGKVYEFLLKEELNLFNALSRKDVQTLKLFLHKNNLNFLDKKWYWEGLPNEDWNFVFRNTPHKDTLIECIKNCGFDGFFNFEWTDNYKDYIEIEKGEKILKAPSLSIFDLSKLKQIKVLSYEDYFRFESFKKEYDEEKNALIDKAVKAKERGQDVFETSKYYIQEHCPFLTERDLMYAVENIDNFKDGVDYSRDEAEDRLYEECSKLGIVFSERIGGWVKSTDNKILYFSNKEHLKHLMEKSELKNFKKAFYENYEVYRKDRKYRIWF